MNETIDILHNEDETSFFDLLSKLWQHKFMITFLVILCAAATFAKVQYFTADTYTTSGILYISNKNEKLSEQETIQKNDVDTSRLLSTTCIEILKTPSFLDDVANDTEQHDNDSLSQAVHISSINETELLKITVTTNEAYLSLKIANTILNKAPDKLLSVYKNGEVEIVDSPKYPLKPDDKNLIMKIIIGGLTGFIIGVAIVFIKSFFDTKVRNSEMIEKRYNVSILGELPE